MYFDYSKEMPVTQAETGGGAANLHDGKQPWDEKALDNLEEFEKFEQWKNM